MNTVLALLAAAFTLAGGEHRVRVVLSEKPEESSKLAAEELTNYVAKASGAVLGICRGPAPSGPCVYIGTVENFPVEVPAEAKKRLAATKNQEAAVTMATENALYFVGKKEVADLYAVYHFLESKLGVIWFRAALPDDPGEYVPELKQIEIAPYTLFREPDFLIRRLDMCCAVWCTIPRAGKTCVVRNGFQVPWSQMLNYLDKPDSEYYRFYRARQRREQIEMGGGHGTFTAPIPASKYFDTHPEYFALNNGKRVKGEHYCFSNPDVQRLTAEYIIANYAKNDNLGSYLFGQTDQAHGWCECPNCVAMDDPGDNAKNSGQPNIATRFNKTAAKIMELVREKIPDADLRVWAYAVYRELPKGIRHDPRVKVQFCDHGRCYGHHFDDPNCPRNKPLFDLLNGWRKVAPDIYTYEYLTCSGMRYICPEMIEEHDIKLYKKLGLIGWKNEAEFTGSQWAKKLWEGAEIQFQSCWQWLWMTGHLLWDTKQDGMKLIEGVEEKYYGEAYPAMKKYHALRRKIWSASPVCYGYPAGDARRPTLLNLPGAKEELYGYLDEAGKLAKGKLVRRRVAEDRKWFTAYWVKPNEELKEKISKAYHVNQTMQPPVIDGDGSDPCWSGAQYVSDFKHPWGNERGQDAPKELATLAGLLYDKDYLYVLIKAKEPNRAAIVTKSQPTGPDMPVWSGEDSVEVFLAPPSVDQCYYQVAANLAGAVYDSAHPGGRASWESGVETKSKLTDEGWTMEMKIPAKGLYPLKRGEIWKLMIARNRPVKDALNKSGSGFTLGGGGYHNTGDYLPIEIGAAYLKNGSFEDVDKDGQLPGWSKISADTKVVRRGNSNCVAMKNCSFFQLITSGELDQKPYPRKMEISFRAKGPGRLNVYILNYNDVHDRKTGKYKRNCLPTKNIAALDIAAEEKLYTLEYEIPAEQWCGLGFHNGKDVIELDDVSVNLKER